MKQQPSMTSSPAVSRQGVCAEEGEVAKRPPGVGALLVSGRSRAPRSLLTGCVLLCSVAVATCSIGRGGGGGRATRSADMLAGDIGFDPDGGLNCSLLEDADKCDLRDGCSWCEGEGDFNASTETYNTTTRCRHWLHCEGPESLCEIRGDQSKCEGPPTLQGGFSSELHAEPATKHKCVWCQTEARCVGAQEPDRGRQPGDDRGQCVGCDDKFDSGLELDMCRVCGGVCVATDMRIENGGCGCLGCDLVPFSGKINDICGVCGGTNSTCSLFPGTVQQQIGVTLALCGNVLISISLNIQKYTHNLNQAASGGEVAYTDIPLWWTGMALMVVGETGGNSHKSVSSEASFSKVTM